MADLSFPGLPNLVQVPDEEAGDYLARGWVRYDPAVSEAQPGPPPRAGRGSSTEAWAEYAASHGVPVAEGADRASIIAACEAAGVPTGHDEQ